MSAILPDVNLLLAFAWSSHPDHRKVRRWLRGLPAFVTCPIAELGFLRVSMSPGYSASFKDAMDVLKAIRGLEGASRIDDDFEVTALPPVDRYRDTTDAYLISLAKAHGLKLATLDKGILKKAWARRVAFHPFATPK